jgi:DNA-directed RNA polymerase subunit RPC12/RpoP
VFEQSISPAGACVGPCNHRAREAWKTYHNAREEHANAMDAWVKAGRTGDAPRAPEPPEVRFFPGDPLMCGRCKAMALRALLDLDMLAGTVAAASDGHRGRGHSESPVSGSKARPSTSPTGDLLDKMLGSLLDAEDEWRQTCGYAPRDFREQRGNHRRSRTIGWLAEHLDALLADPDMVPFYRTVLNWETVLRKAAKDDAGKTNIRCTKCSQRRVSWDEESRHYRCGSCSTLISQKEHDRQEHEELGEAAAPELAETR